MYYSKNMRAFIQKIQKVNKGLNKNMLFYKKNYSFTLQI